MKKILLILPILALLLVAIPGVASAYDFGYAISDEEFTNKDSLTLNRIQSFLENKGSYLATFNLEIEGKKVRASDLIYNAAQEYSINPKIILINLQKEQSLITNGDPTQRALDCAMGYEYGKGCQWMFDNKPQYKGFANQVDAGAWQFNRYMQNPDTGYYTHVGETITRYNSKYGTQTFKIKNQATAALATYTTSLSGITMIKDLMIEWFELTHYPNGSLLQNASTGGVYLIEKDEKRAIISMSALYANYNPNTIILVSPDILDQYEDGDQIKFVDNTLIRSPKGTVYMIRNGARRGFASGDALRQFGFNPEEIIDVGWSDINQLDEVDPITIKDSFPVGGLLQSIETGAVYYISSKGTIYPIWDKAIMVSRFSNRRYIPMYQEDIEKFNTGNPLKFKDGTLVTSPSANSVYVISDGKKQPFKSGDDFIGLGYKWENVVHTTDAALKLHQLGDYIEIK